MRSHLVKQALCIRGELKPPADKSIAHRAVILSAISPGKTTIENFPTNKDCLSTIKVFQKLGVRIKKNLHSLRKNSKTKLTIFGNGLCGLKKPKSPIFVGESGTSLRLILGVLAGESFQVTLTAGKSLSQRPMLRVTKPLRLMGAQIKAKARSQESKAEEFPPITIRGGNLRPITYQIPIASAQVKSAILLAGLYAKGITKVIEPIKTRDHTERMLKLFRAGIESKKNVICIRGKKELVSPGNIYIPGDISSASFFIVAAAILPGSQLLIKNVSLNPSRIGILKVLKRMGANIKIKKPCLSVSQKKNYEPMGDLAIRASLLRGTIVKKEETPSLIDELPILMVAASVASGRTIFERVGELRFKETDRINSMCFNLRRMGVKIKTERTNHSENIIIEGQKELKGANVKSFNDHRTAMSMVIAGLRVKGETRIDDVSCISKSFPDFLSILKSLIP